MSFAISSEYSSRNTDEESVSVEDLVEGAEASTANKTACFSESALSEYTSYSATKATSTSKIDARIPYFAFHRNESAGEVSASETASDLHADAVVYI